MNKDYKEYKIWRFVYNSYIDKILIPNDVKLYCINKDRSDELSIHNDELNKPIWNETYIAVMPYSKELWELSHDHRQSCNLCQFNVNNQYIIWLLDQIYPISDDFPETDEVPIVPVSFICYRMKRVKYNTDEYLEKLKQINKMGLSPIGKELKLKDTFMPVYEYVKIHGLDKKYKGHLDITSVTVKSWIDGTPYFNIRRQSLNIKDVLWPRKDEHIERVTELKYNYIFDEVIKQLKGK